MRNPYLIGAGVVLAIQIPSIIIALTQSPEMAKPVARGPVAAVAVQTDMAVQEPMPSQATPETAIPAEYLNDQVLMTVETATEPDLVADTAMPAVARADAPAASSPDPEPGTIIENVITVQTDMITAREVSTTQTPTDPDAVIAELPFTGIWTCGADMILTITSDSYALNDDTSVAIIETQQFGDSTMALRLEDGMIVNMDSLTKENMFWSSPSQDNSYPCTQVS